MDTVKSRKIVIISEKEEEGYEKGHHEVIEFKVGEVRARLRSWGWRRRAP